MLVTIKVLKISNCFIIFRFTPFSVPKTFQLSSVSLFFSYWCNYLYTYLYFNIVPNIRVTTFIVIYNFKIKTFLIAHFSL